MYEFGPFRLDPATRALYRGAEFIPLTPKAAEILLLLVQEAGRVVTKEQLLERVWPAVVVEEGTIANNISALRKVIDNGEFGVEGPIATVPRRGYRFTAEVRQGQVVAPVPTGAQSPPPITERDTILIADIDNRTGDPIFDGTIRQALLLHLAQSPYLEIVTDQRVLAVLGYMGKRGATVTGDVALEICQRTGTKAAITGSIFAFGDEYLIGLQALQGNTGAIVASEQSRARGKGEVLKALDAAAIGLRTKLGESLPSIERFSKSFDEVATSSLEAVKAYSMGRIQWLANGEAAGKPHYLRAIEIDAEFSAAYSALAHVCANMGQTEEATRYMQRAYDLRDRATERERVRLISGYHGVVTGELFKGIDGALAWQSNYPRDSTAFGNAGDMLMQAGQWEKALASNQRGHTLEVTNISSSNLALCLMALGRHDEARAVLDDAFARGITAFYLHLDAYLEAFLRNDTTDMKRHAYAVSKPTEEDFLLGAQADTEAFHGRHARARELSRRAVESARDSGTPEMAAMWEAQAALREVEMGELELARAGAHAALRTFRGRDVNCLVAYVLARCGEAGESQRLSEVLDREYPQNTIVQRYWLPCIRAAHALEAKDWKAALDALETAGAVELSLSKPFEYGFMIPCYLRGLALAGAGRGDDAALEFRKIVERPGLIKNFVLLPLARAQIAKAQALAAN